MGEKNVDFSILDFNNYDEYLASFTCKEDYQYMPSGKHIAALIKLGIRSTKVPYTPQEFKIRQELATEALQPKVAMEQPFSRFMSPTNTDPVLLEFKRREPGIFSKSLSVGQTNAYLSINTDTTKEHLPQTIVFTMFTNRKGSEISAYMDLGMSWKNTKVGAYNHMNWQGIYSGTALLRPKIHHLSYRNSQKNITLYTDSDNFSVMHHDEYGLMFMHKGDHKYITVGCRKTPLDRNVRRSMCTSPKYGTIIFYDHVLRKKA